MRAVLIAAACLLACAGCRRDMQDQPRYEALEATTFFPDGRSARQPVAGTVARGGLAEDPWLATGKVDGAFVTEFPFPITDEIMSRGRQRYEIFCAPCHSRVGDGRGMVVRRGFPQAASFHIDRLRDAQVGYIYDVVSNGFGRMYGYGAQIAVKDRWAIVAYVRALQLAGNARLADVPPEARADLQKAEDRR